MGKANRYEILETIYKGMAARSYRARDPKLDRLVFLKILHPNLASDPQWVKRFEREAMIHAKLKHPNIVMIYELGKGEQFYIASEYIQGITLKQLIVQQGRLKLKALSSIILQVVAALRYAHKKGIVHRDLKPANILITKDNDIKLTDFGLAFAKDYGSITQQGFVLGTPAYMSPEQARGKKVDFRSDIFSLGVTIYEALSGKNPFKGGTYADSISRVLNTNPDALVKVVPDTPVEVSDIVSKMLVKKPEKRVSKLDKVESVFVPHVGAVNTKPRRRIPLRYAVILIPVFIFGFILLKSRPLTHTKEAITGSALDTASAQVVVIDTPNLPSTSPAQPVEEPFSALVKPVREYFKLQLKILPWADVYIDGDFIGTTPFGKDIELKQGTHRIVLQNPYFPTITEDIEISAPCSLIFDFKERCALLDIDVKPWAIIYIDELLVDTTPLKRPLAVTLGEHTITVKHFKLGERVEKVKTDSAKLYQFIFDLTDE